MLRTTSTLGRAFIPKSGHARLAGVRNAFSVPLVISVMGGPGSGKGTQCTRLQTFLADDTRLHPCKARLPRRIYHINVGMLLRDEALSNPDLRLDDGKSLSSWLADGRIVPSSVSVGIIQKEIKRITAEIAAAAAANAAAPRSPITPPYPPAILLDGFPRSLENLKAYEAAIGPLNAMVLVDVDPAVMMERVARRSQSGHKRSDDAMAAQRTRVFEANMGKIEARFTAVAVDKIVENGGAENMYDARALRMHPICVHIDGNGDVEGVQAQMRAAVTSLVNAAY